MYLSAGEIHTLLNTKQTKGYTFGQVIYYLKCVEQCTCKQKSCLCSCMYVALLSSMEKFPVTHINNQQYFISVNDLFAVCVCMNFSDVLNMFYIAEVPDLIEGD